MKLWTTCGREVTSTSLIFLCPPLLLVKKCSPSLSNGQKGLTPSWPTTNSYWDLWLHFLGCFVKLDGLASQRWLSITAKQFLRFVKCVIQIIPFLKSDDPACEASDPDHPFCEVWWSIIRKPYTRNTRNTKKQKIQKLSKIQKKNSPVPASNTQKYQKYQKYQ